MVHLQQEDHLISFFWSSDAVNFVWDRVERRFHMRQFAKYTISEHSLSDFYGF